MDDSRAAKKMDSPRRIPAALSRWAQREWFSEGAPADFIAARVLVCLNALWLVLSRPDIAELTSWPDVFWAHVSTADRIRFLVFPVSAALERLLYCALVVLVILVAANVQTRWTAIVAAVLLYHFAALEPLVGSVGLLWFQCFTHLILGLVIIAAASPSRELRRPFDDRWPVVLLRTLVALYYFVCGFEKLVVIGPRWVSIENIEAVIRVQEAREVFHTPLASAVASSSAACATIAFLTIVLELGFPLAVFSRTARRVIVPAAFAGHVGIALTLGLVFLNWPLILLFVNWGWVSKSLRENVKIVSIATRSRAM